MRSKTLQRHRRRAIESYLSNNPGAKAQAVADAMGLHVSIIHDAFRVGPMFASPRHGQWCMTRDLHRFQPPAKPKSQWRWWEHLNALMAEDYEREPEAAG